VESTNLVLPTQLTALDGDFFLPKTLHLAIQAVGLGKTQSLGVDKRVMVAIHNNDAGVQPPCPVAVAVVVVAWNSGAALERCVAAALRQSPAEVVVVDNASTDASIARVRAAFPAVRVVRLAENIGFAAGCNLGVAVTHAPYVLFLNDDAELDAGYLPTLVEALAAQPRAASAVGKLVDVRREGRFIDSAGIMLVRHALRPDDRGHGEADWGQYDGPSEIFGPTGAAALYRREALLDRADTPFDAALFAYYEDVDLAWRLRRRGWKHLYIPTATARHPRRGQGVKPRRMAVRAFVNRYTVWLKHESARRFLRYGALALAWEAARLVRVGLRDPKFLAGIGGALLPALQRGWRARRREHRLTRGVDAGGA
jgi:GT2 family glycosyltransferase